MCATFYRNIEGVMKPFWMQSSDRVVKTELDGIHKMYIESHVTVFSRMYNFLFLESFVALCRMRDSTRAILKTSEQN